MDAQGIAQWLIANPQAWFQLAEYIAEKNWEYAEQLADTFGDMACNYAPALDGQPSEQQEWHDFDPDC